MVNVDKNKALNKKLLNLYHQKTDTFLQEYKKAFSDDRNPPDQIGTFGIVDENWYDIDNGILVILKETNGWSNEDFCTGNTYIDFVRDISERGRAVNDGRERGEWVSMLMWYNLGRWLTAIQTPQKSTDEIAELYEEALKNLSAAAITNVNKVRGCETSGRAYSAMARSIPAIDTIKEEIAILNPETIMFCGTYRLFEDSYIEELEKKGIKVLELCHPAARKSKREMIDTVKKYMNIF